MNAVKKWLELRLMTKMMSLLAAYLHHSRIYLQRFLLLCLLLFPLLLQAQSLRRERCQSARPVPSMSWPLQ